MTIRDLRYLLPLGLALIASNPIPPVIGYSLLAFILLRTSREMPTEDAPQWRLLLYGVSVVAELLGGFAALVLAYVAAVWGLS